MGCREKGRGLTLVVIKWVCSKEMKVEATSIDGFQNMFGGEHCVQGIRKHHVCKSFTVSFSDIFLKICASLQRKKTLSL